MRKRKGRKNRREGTKRMRKRRKDQMGGDR